MLSNEKNSCIFNMQIVDQYQEINIKYTNYQLSKASTITSLFTYVI